MLRRVVKHDPVGGVAQEGGPRRLALQNATLAFHAQLDVQIRLICHQVHQRLRLMDVQIVHHEVPACDRRVAHQHLLHMAREILLSSCWSSIWSNDLPAHDIAAENERAGAMPDVLELAPFDLARRQRQAGMLALQGLPTGQFISTHRALSLLCSLRCLAVGAANRGDLFVQLLLLGGSQPIAAEMRLEIPFLSRRAAWRGEIWATMPRLTTSSAISRPVHWLTGRPAVSGASQAKATIWQRCSAVMVTGRPVRGTSLRRSSSESSERGMGAKASQRWRQRRTVSTSRLSWRAIWELLEPSAPARMMRQRVASCCGREWRRSRSSSSWRTSGASTTSGGFGPRTGDLIA